MSRLQLESACITTMYKALNNRRVILCIHGFGAFCSNEFLPLFEYMKDFEKDYDLVAFDLYDADDVHPHYKKWVARAKTTVEYYQQLYDEVVLLGFSMGGLIATHLSTILPGCEAMILVAPAYRLINYHTLHNIIKPQHAKEQIPIEQKTSLFQNHHVFPLYFGEFIKCVTHLRPSKNKCTSNVIVFHAPEDEYVPYEGTLIALHKMKGSYRKLYTCEKGAHELLIHPQFMETIGKEIDFFMNIKYNHYEK